MRLVGVAALAQGKLAIAQEMLDAALQLAQQKGGALNEAEILQARSALHDRLGDHASRRRDALAAIAIFERLQAHHDRQMLTDWLRERDPASGV